LRLTRGVDLEQVRGEFGTGVVTRLGAVLVDLASFGLVDWEGDWVRLTSRGRLLSNEVFERFLVA
jgi:oxygen-independent coproporphyrinogen-3 oxidase